MKKMGGNFYVLLEGWYVTSMTCSESRKGLRAVVIVFAHLWFMGRLNSTVFLKLQCQPFNQVHGIVLLSSKYCHFTNVSIT